MYTLQNIKDEYYTELALGNIYKKSFDDYLRENYQQIYDNDLNFLGWERDHGQTFE